MPNCDFYAAGTDHRSVLDFLLTHGECDIYELASRFEKPLQQFRSLSDFEAHFAIADWRIGSSVTMHLQLYAHRSGGHFIARRVSLNPESCNGATFRYSAEGWGLIQLYLEAPRHGRLSSSHTNHNSAKRAEVWSDTIENLGSPSDWDWNRVSSFSGRLNRFIRSLAVAKDRSRPILPHAAALQSEGVVFQG
jgi:hypothetical protein